MMKKQGWNFDFFLSFSSKQTHSKNVQYQSEPLTAIYSVFNSQTSWVF